MDGVQNAEARRSKLNAFVEVAAIGRSNLFVVRAVVGDDASASIGRVGKLARWVVIR